MTVSYFYHILVYILVYLCVTSSIFHHKSIFELLIMPAESYRNSINDDVGLTYVMIYIMEIRMFSRIISRQLNLCLTKCVIFLRWKNFKIWVKKS